MQVQLAALAVVFQLGRRRSSPKHSIFDEMRRVICSPENDEAEAKARAMRTEIRLGNHRKMTTDLRTILLESGAMVCTKVHQPCRTRDKGSECVQPKVA